MKPLLKPLFIITFCLLFVLTARAAEDKHKKKHAQEAQVQQGQGQTQAVVKPGKHRGGRVGVQTNTGVQATNPNLTNKQQRRLLRQQDSNVPAVQSGAQVNANAQLHTGGKHKFQAKKFQTKKGPDPSIASEQFQEGKKIKNSEKWQGKQYVAFKNYKSQKHHKDWWHHHHHRIILIGGGWYYWNMGYWYPAWGYDDYYSYYPYDGPIYAYNDLPPDQVIANVQASLQAQGYYHGEVDGLLGPLTRAALASYQQSHGLYITSAIDEPTLASLGMV